MNQVQDWKNDISSIPFGPLGVIAMAGCEEMGAKINTWLEKWHHQQEDVSFLPRCPYG